MKIIGNENEESGSVDTTAKSEESADKSGNNGIFSEENLMNNTVVDKNDVAHESLLSSPKDSAYLKIDASDKIKFIDAVVNNTRFEKDYSLFGGRIRFTVRSMTSEESQALSVWAIRNGATNPYDQIAGRYRKYLLSAQISMYNGVEMPPLEEPLFPVLESDGKTVKEPGWINRSYFWDKQHAGVVQAIVNCVEDFDKVYSTLCKKGADENFWLPDTP